MDTVQGYHELHRMIERNEGRSQRPYLGRQGDLSIGVGRNLDRDGLTQKEVDLMLATDVETAIYNLTSYKWFWALSAPRVFALVDVMFSTGPAEFWTYGTLLEALENSNWPVAADSLLDTTWAKCHGSRAYRDARALLTDVMP